MRQTIILGICLLGLAAAAPAAGGDFGLGFIIGEPTGLSGKLWLSENSAFDAAAAWSFEGEDAVDLHGDFLLHRFDLFALDDMDVPFYYGLGARLKLEEDDSLLGVRLPLGVSFMWEETSLELFFEIVPLMDLAPDTEFHLNGGLGLRYYFGGSGER